MNDDFMEGIRAYEEEARWKDLRFASSECDGYYSAHVHYGYLKIRYPDEAEPFKAAMLQGIPYDYDGGWVLTPVLVTEAVRK